MDAIIKRSFLIVFVIFAVYLISKIYPSSGEKFPNTKWTTKSIYKLLFLFLIVEYAVSILLGGLYYKDILSFLITSPRLRDSLGGIIIECFILFVVWYVVTKKYKLPFIFLGFEKNRIKPGLIWGVGFLLLVELVIVFLKYFRCIPISSESFKEEVNILWLLSLFITAPIAEEVFYRGYVYPNFRNRVGIIWAILLSSVCFVAFHTLWTAWPNILISGIIFCYLYEKSGSLIAPIIAHISSNIMGFLISYHSGLFLYAISWPIMWVLLFVTFFIFLTIPRLVASKGFIEPYVVTNVPVIKDNAEIIKKAERKGWIIAFILGLIILYLIFGNR